MPLRSPLPPGGCADRWRSCRSGWLRPPAGASGRRLCLPGRPPKRGSLPATERAVARPEEPYGRRRVAPRGVTGTAPAGERRGLVPERPANAAVAGPVSAGCGQSHGSAWTAPGSCGGVSPHGRIPRCWWAGAPHPPLSLRSVVGRVVFHVALCAALRVPWPTPLVASPGTGLHGRRAALRLIPAVLPLWRRRKVILWSLLRQGPRRTRLSPWHAMGPRLDTRSRRIGLRRVESKNTNCRDEPHPVEQNAKASLGDRGRN